MPFRQQILTKLSLLIFLFTFFACGSKTKNDLAMTNLLSQNLENSNKTISYSTFAQLKELENKTTEWATMEKANIWFSRAELIADFSRISFDFIQKKKLKSKFDDTDLKEVCNSLLVYKKLILGRDSSLQEQFKNDFLFINNFKKLVSADTSLSTTRLNKKISMPFINAALLSLQNDIKIIENKTVTYCNMKIGETDGAGFYDYYSFIVGQNSGNLKPGENLEITAGIGAFSISGKPVITINGKNIKVGEDGYSLYKLRVSKTPGNYKVPVKISFFNQTTGKDEKMETTVKYTVAKECNE